jgi:hypothetical protein
LVLKEQGTYLEKLGETNPNCFSSSNHPNFHHFPNLDPPARSTPLHETLGGLTSKQNEIEGDRRQHKPTRAFLYLQLSNIRVTLTFFNTFCCVATLSMLVDGFSIGQLNFPFNFSIDSSQFRAFELIGFSGRSVRRKKEGICWKFVLKYEEFFE